MQAQKIIIIHPGSLYLRIGRASDLNPMILLHAIGRRRKQLEKHIYSDSLLPSVIGGDQHNINLEFEEQINQINKFIRTQNKNQYFSPSTLQEISNLNGASTPTVFSLDNTAADTNAGDAAIFNDDQKSEIIFDETILKLSPKSIKDYNVHFPYRRGELNLHNEVGGSLTAILSDLEAIWGYAIHDRMGIPKGALAHYGAVLIISDIYNRSILKELVTLVLLRLCFRACFLLQDHVAAAFGAGLSYACVVDVGDQKCSISCVEDGISQSDTRVRLGYGGGDMTQIFLKLLQKSNFPYKECNVENDYNDAILIMQLKEKLCHLNFDSAGVQEKDLQVIKPTERLVYKFKICQEGLIASLCYFRTELLNISGKQRLVRLQLRSSQQPDPEDCFDAEYLRETGRVRNGRGDQLEGNMPAVGDAIDEDLASVDPFDVEERGFNTRSSSDKDEQLNYFFNSGQIIPLDLAIIRSIERCPSDDFKRKMYSCILLVGGGSKLPGINKLLERKISMQLSTNATYRSTATTPFEVNVCIKEMDPTMISWKGAAIMSCLESAPELWLFAKEWDKHGLKMLREKAIFIW